MEGVSIWWWVGVGVLVGGVFVYAWVGPRATAAGDGATAVAHLVDEAQAIGDIDDGPPDHRAAVASGAALLDVRTPDEFRGGHVDGAINIPVADLEARLDELPPGGDVVVYCRSGQRSARAARVLERAGHAVTDIGAMSRW